MIRISHRGNTDGPNPKRENIPTYIVETLERGFDVEVDIRYIDGQYYLGHDYPRVPISLDFLKNPRLWCHAKDGTTLRKALTDGLHVFYDSNPAMNYTLTSRGYIWHWDGVGLIYVMDKNGLIGMCSDYVGYL